ncbi:MAG: DUF308 domain-containing protein [Clostridiales bacterium]|nr:DUF308 domain-containing protein [Clostridiales bacterium]
MPWCPVCKNEYREGFETCSDCRVSLVDNLTQINDNLPIAAKFEDKAICEKFEKYLEYTGIDFITKETESLYVVTVSEDDFHRTMLALSAFCNVEKDLFMEKNIDSSYFVGSKKAVMEELKEQYNENIYDEAKLAQDNNEEFDDMMRQGKKILSAGSLYTSKREVAEETYSSGIMFIIFGIAGLAFMVLNTMNIVDFFARGFSSIVMFIFFGAMFIGGIYSCISSKKIKSDADVEDKFVEELKNYLDSAITPEDLKKVDLPDELMEVNYIHRINYIKDKIQNQYGYELDDAFLDSFIEDYYNEHFEENI